MTRKTVLSIVFLSVTAVAVGWELVAVVNPHDDLTTWTDLISTYIPPEVAWAAIALLDSWLPGHFLEAYAQRGKTMTIPLAPGPDAPREPLLTAGTVTAVTAAAVAAAVAFGLPLTDAQTGAVLTVVALLAPLAVALLARRKVFSPATVRDMIVFAAQSGKVKPPPRG